MNLTIQDTYFDWRQLSHAVGCARPSWTVDLREDQGYRSSYATARPVHGCPDEDCDHGSTFPRLTVRVVCSSCHTAHVIRGENPTFRLTTTKTTGVGEAPRRVAGLCLWPGMPWFDGEPHQWLATRTAPVRVQPADVVGEIHEERGPRGGTRYAALALPTPDGRYGLGTLRWQRVQEDLRTLAAAAKWIAAQHPEDGDTA
ncbi:hypothetical protein [Streptomyces sp. NPDC058045]|uniref:hypothetical protein n=1 Tax=Streptomyces sp. NPDC058045 TaxID=3346311 RepID=UPI0036E4EC3C